MLVFKYNRLKETQSCPVTLLSPIKLLQRWDINNCRSLVDNLIFKFIRSR